MDGFQQKVSWTGKNVRELFGGKRDTSASHSKKKKGVEQTSWKGGDVVALFERREITEKVHRQMKLVNVLMLAKAKFKGLLKSKQGKESGNKVGKSMMYGPESAVLVHL